MLDSQNANKHGKLYCCDFVPSVSVIALPDAFWKTGLCHRRTANRHSISSCVYMSDFTRSHVMRRSISAKTSAALSIASVTGSACLLRQPITRPHMTRHGCLLVASSMISQSCCVDRVRLETSVAAMVSPGLATFICCVSSGDCVWHRSSISSGYVRLLVLPAQAKPGSVG